MTRMTQEQCKDTGMAIVLILLLLISAFQWYALVPWAIGVQVVNMTFPRAFDPAAVVWFAASRALGTVVSRVVLSIMFFAVVTPIGIVRRFVARDALQLRAFKNGRESVMHERNHTFDIQDLRHPY